MPSLVVAAGVIGGIMAALAGGGVARHLPGAARGRPVAGGCDRGQHLGADARACSRRRSTTAPSCRRSIARSPLMVLVSRLRRARRRAVLLLVTPERRLRANWCRSCSALRPCCSPMPGASARGCARAAASRRGERRSSLARAPAGVDLWRLFRRRRRRAAAGRAVDRHPRRLPRRQRDQEPGGRASTASPPRSSSSCSGVRAVAADAGDHGGDAGRER